MAECSYNFSHAYEAVMDFAYAITGDVWRWFNLLNREEWMVVLAVVATGGFLCMRGFGSRNEY